MQTRMASLIAQKTLYLFLSSLVLRNIPKRVFSFKDARMKFFDAIIRFLGNPYSMF